MNRAERCSLCACLLTRTAGTYADSTIEGRSHATGHHVVAERFFGRSQNRPAERREAIFERCPWGAEGVKLTFCYECHEELLHNPVLLPDDILKLANLVKRRKLNEDRKPADRQKIAGRIVLLREVLLAGLDTLIEKEM